MARSASATSPVGRPTRGDIDCPHYFEARSEPDIRERLRKYAAATVLGLRVPPLPGDRGQERFVLLGRSISFNWEPFGSLFARRRDPWRSNVGGDWRQPEIRSRTQLLAPESTRWCASAARSRVTGLSMSIDRAP